MTWNQIGYHAKPCRLLDVDSYYACLTDHLNRMIKEGFVPTAHQRIAMTSPDPTELIYLFKKHNSPHVEKRIERKKGL